MLLNARAVAILGAGKSMMGQLMSLHKRKDKDGGTQWFYRYTIQRTLP